MALNREQKRLMKKKGEAGEDDESATEVLADLDDENSDGEDVVDSDDNDDGGSRPRRSANRSGSKSSDRTSGATKEKNRGAARNRDKDKGGEDRTTVRVFTKEVRGELRKVAWPSRKETFQYSSVVALALIVLTTMIFVLDYVFQEIVLRLFNVK